MQKNRSPIKKNYGFGITSLPLGDPLRGRDDQAKPGQLALDGFFVFRTFSCEHDGPKISCKKTGVLLKKIM
ncbi:MAG: hypothetical protein ACJATA_001281, partial [Sphingobacteriales bacterium]